jgi:hypothetical protein
MTKEQTSQEELDNLNKALKNVLSPEDYDEFVKAKKEPETNEAANGGKEEALEKAYNLAKGELKASKKAFSIKKAEMLKNPELKELKKAFKSKKKEIKKAFGEMWEKEKADKEKAKLDKKECKEKETEKSVTPDLVKSLTDSFNSKIDQMLQSNNDLVKSLTDENTSLKKAVETLSKEGLNFRSAKNFQVVEKANHNELDEDGRTLLHTSTQKKLVISALETAFEKANDPTIKKSIQDDIMAYNLAPDGSVSREVAEYLYNNHKVRLVK